LRIPWSLTIPDALRATDKDVNIAQYWAFTIPDALRATEKKFSLILVRGSQMLPILVYSIFGPDRHALNLYLDHRLSCQLP